MSTKNYILNAKKLIDFKRNYDNKINKLYNKYNRESNEIKDLFFQLSSLTNENSDDDDLIKYINEELERLNNLNKQTRMDYLNKFKENKVILDFSEKYNGLFEKFCLENVNMDTLEHCLDTFDEYTTGQLDFETAKMKGFNRYKMNTNNTDKLLNDDTNDDIIEG